MVEIGEIEESYQKDIERVEKEFLAGVKAGKSARELDKVYRDKIKLARDKYYKKMTEFIEKSKHVAQKKEKKKVEEFKRFRVVPAQLTLSRYQRNKNKYGLKWFKFRFKWRNRIRGMTPNFVLRFRIWLRMKFKRMYRFVTRIIARVLNWFKELAVKIYKRVMSFLKWVLGFLVSLPGKFFGLFKRKKKSEGKEGEKKEDGEAAEKKEGEEDGEKKEA